MIDKKIQMATKAIVIKKNQILALYIDRETDRLWDFPGGRIEFGENLEEGLKREVMEETGCKVKIHKLIDSWSNVISSQHQVVGVFYLCELEGEITLSEEHTGYKWINIDEFFDIFTAKAFTERMINWDWNKITIGKNF